MTGASSTLDACPVRLDATDPATVGVSRKMGDVLNRAGAQWEPRLLANLYAAAALEADDAQGEAHDLITQHYGIVKADLVLVLDLAAGALDGRHAVPNNVHDNCPSCDATFALGRIGNTVEWTSAPAGAVTGRAGARASECPPGVG